MSKVTYRVGPRVYQFPASDHSLLVEAAARVCGSQQLLAERLGISRSTISRWLDGSLEISETRWRELDAIVSGGEP